MTWSPAAGNACEQRAPMSPRLVYALFCEDLRIFDVPMSQVSRQTLRALLLISFLTVNSSQDDFCGE